MKKKFAKRAPKSQSEKASDKKAKALERAGTAIIAGKKGKAKKILDAQKKRESKKPSAKQATEILSEAHTIEMQLTAIEHKIDGIKEEYKELKAQRERLVVRLRSEVRDMGQGRLPFGNPPKGETKPSRSETKAAVGETKSAPGDAKSASGDAAAPNDEAPVSTGEAKDDQIDRELGGESERGTENADDGLPAPAARTPRSRGKRTGASTHESAA